MLTSIRIVFRAFRQFEANRGPAMGAALAYYALFSTAPLLVLSVLIAAAVFDEQTARDRLQAHLTELVGPESTRELIALMERTSAAEPNEQPEWLKSRLPAWVQNFSWLGIGLLLLGALGLALHLRKSLLVIWRLGSGSGGFLAKIMNYALAVIVVLLVGVVLLVSLGVSTGVSMAVTSLGAELPGGKQTWRYLDMGLSFLLLALIYRVMSGRQIDWGHAFYGAIITAVLFTAGKTLVGMYLAYAGTAAAYGAAHALVAFLVWVYYSSQIVLFGAELIQARRTKGEWLGARGS